MQQPEAQNPLNVPLQSLHARNPRDSLPQGAEESRVLATANHGLHFRMRVRVRRDLVSRHDFAFQIAGPPCRPIEDLTQTQLRTIATLAV